MTYLVGLTGGIGSGKTTVARLFENLGVTIVDADAIAKALCEPNQAGLLALQQLLPTQLPYTEDKKLDRRALRTLLFNDPEIKTKVEQVLHPLIKAKLFEQALAATSPYVLLVIPLLIETAWHQNVDRVLVVDVPESVQLERLIQRDNLDADLAQKMIHQQASRQARLAFATDVIDNTQPLEQVTEAVKKLHQHFLSIMA